MLLHPGAPGSRPLGTETGSGRRTLGPESTRVKVAVVGAGKLGLPLACQLARRGARVTACDVDADRVEAIRRGECPIDEPGVPELMASLVAEGRLDATVDTAGAAGESGAIVVIVPALLTPDRDIDAGALQQVSREIARTLQPGTLVSYETTMPVGGTRRLLLPLLEAGGLRAGRDFDLVFSPERVKSREILRHLETRPKVLGGHTREAAERAAEFYGRYLGAPVLDAGSLEGAELVKLAGMVYRDVNIALSNEIACYCEILGVDLTELVGAINTDGEAALLEPGIGVGGHCTPVYPHFLIRDAARRGLDMRLATLARAVNDDQVSHSLDRLEARVGRLAGVRVLLLGLGFRPGVKEHAFSPAFLLRDQLSRRGAHVTLDDPLYRLTEIEALGFAPGSLDRDPAPEIVVLNTAHPAYLELDFGELAKRGLRAVLDGRNAWSPGAVRAEGLVYLGIGRPDVPGVGQEGR
jgi:nucleotide sugar dehydrogenase